MSSIREKLAAQKLVREAKAKTESASTATTATNTTNTAKLNRLAELASLYGMTVEKFEELVNSERGKELLEQALKAESEVIEFNPPASPEKEITPDEILPEVTKIPPTSNSIPSAPTSINQPDTGRNTSGESELTYAGRESTPVKLTTAELTPVQIKLASIRARLAAEKEVNRKALTTQAEELKPENQTATTGTNPDLTIQLPTSAISQEVLESLPVELADSIRGKRSKNEISKDDLNEQQLEAVRLAQELQPFCLVGSAGSGKTTTTRIISDTLYEEGKIGELPEGTKFLDEGAPSIIFVSFTNQAVYNIREAVPDEFKKNCLTIHKLLEYMPVFYEIPDGLGGTKKTMRYEPQRTSVNPIRGITVCVIEEAGNIPTELTDKLFAALPYKTVFIYLGDLNQIPPVFGDAILGFKLLELPIVELKQSYRTDNDSPIRLLAYEILKGKPIPDKSLEPFNTPGKLELIRFKDRVDPEPAVAQMGKHLQSLVRSGEFNPEEDVVLTPYKVNFGTNELNRHIAQARTEILRNHTFEVIVGFNKVYYAVGDIVYYAKTKWEVVDINRNHLYTGKSPQPASLTLDRWGINSNSEEYKRLSQAQEAADMEALFNSLAKADVSNEIALRQASHTLTLRDCAGERGEITIGDVGDINSLYFAYALTVHKALGSEWKKVFCIFHHSQGRMVNREILYTAVTRARDFLRVYFYGETPEKRNGSCFQAGIINQAIPGNCLEDKLKYFRRKLKAQAIKFQAELARSRGEKLDMGLINSKSSEELISMVVQGKKEAEALGVVKEEEEV